jgi:hypothetical protein
MIGRFTGGCMCGAVRYECGVDPIAMGNCPSGRSCERGDVAPDAVGRVHRLCLARKERAIQASKTSVKVDGYSWR